MVEGFLAEINSQIWLIFAVFLRIGPAFSLTPGYGESYVSVRVKLSVAMMFSLAIAPILQPYLPVIPPMGFSLLLFALKEIILGYFIGIFARGMIFLLEKAGAIISQSISLAQMLGNATEPMPVISHILTTTGIAILYSTSLDDQILYSYVKAYGIGISDLLDLLPYMAAKSTELINFVFKHGVVLASGFMGVMFIYYIYIGFVNKAMPQFMVSFIGVPFVSLFSIFFLYQHFDLLLNVWQRKALVIFMIPFGEIK